MVRGRQLALLAVTLGICAALAEAALRWLPAPPDDAVASTSHAPVMLEPDARLGWRPKPGHYVYPGYAPLDDGSAPPDVEVTVMPNRTRFTGPAVGRAEDAVVLLGCSYTFGQAVSDHETYAFKMQQALGWPVYNWAVPGFGSYQAYLRLDEALDSLAKPPRYVVYGFADFHATRNAAAIAWLKGLRRLGGTDETFVAVPYASVASNGEPEYHPPIAYPKSALQSEWLLYRLFYERGLNLLAKWRTYRKVDTTIAILRAMQRKSSEHGTQLVVMQLHRPNHRSWEKYGPFIEASGLPYVECDAPAGEAYTVKGEGHPNGLAHSHYARCISDYLRALSSSSNPSTRVISASHEPGVGSQ